MPTLNPEQFNLPDEEQGQWDRSGDEPRWVQPHHILVQNALHQWKGDPTGMSIHMHDEASGAPQPSSGSGKKMRAQAAALMREVGNAPPNDRPLYRGSHRTPSGMESYSESRRVASGWARKGGGTVHTMAPGAGRAIRVKDHISSGIDEGEREWVARPH